MKVRHKASGTELELAEPQPFLPQWWKTVGGSCIAYNDPAWELVKEEEWEDVTAECDFNSQFGLGVRVQDGGTCRLRKIDGLHNGPAFIVERRKS